MAMTTLLSPDSTILIRIMLNRLSNDEPVVRSASHEDAGEFANVPKDPMMAELSKRPPLV